MIGGLGAPVSCLRRKDGFGGGNGGFKAGMADLGRGVASQERRGWGQGWRV